MILRCVVCYVSDGGGGAGAVSGVRNPGGARGHQTRVFVIVLYPRSVGSRPFRVSFAVTVVVYEQKGELVQKCAQVLQRS